jgi:hypothetical protein
MKPPAVWAEGERGFLSVGLGRRIGALARFVSNAQKFTHPREVFTAVALGEKAVMPDAVKAVGEDMQEKAAQELMRAKPYDAASPASAIVLVAKRHLGVGDVDQPGIADGGPMGVAGEIGQHALRPAERGLGVDDERALAKRAQALGESGGRGERRQIA